MKTVPPPTPEEIAAMEWARWARIAARRASKNYVNDWTEPTP